MEEIILYVGLDVHKKTLISRSPTNVPTVRFDPTVKLTEPGVGQTGTETEIKRFRSSFCL